MYCLPRPRLPLRLQSLESRIAPAVITQGDRSFTDTEILVGIRSDDPLFHLTGRVVTNRWNDFDLLNSSLLYRRESTGVGVLEVALNLGVDPVAAVAKLQAQPGVTFAEVNLVTLGDPREWVPNDPLYASPGQWHIGKMQVDKAWDITKGTPGVIVAVLDDGLPTAVQHQDLKANRWLNDDVTSIAGDDDGNGYINDTFGWDFVDDDRIPDPIGASSHGTQVAGIIAATSNNGKGVTGVVGGDNGTGGARLMSLRIYGGSLDVATLSKGITYAADNGAKIINLSYTVDDFVGSQVFIDAMNHAYSDTKSLLFFSAGNNNTESAARSVLTQPIFVANTTQTDARFSDPSYGSNYGNWVDISAPGTAIVTTLTYDDGTIPNEYQIDTNTTTLNTGTSFASPNAAAVAAMIWSKNPSWTRDQVAAQLFGTADNIDAANPGLVGKMGTGRANAYRALTETLKTPTIDGFVNIPAEGGVVSDLKTFGVKVTSRLATISVTSSAFELRSDGNDNTFDTVDDVVVPLVVSPYRMGSNTIDLALPTSANTERYRLTVFSGGNGLTNPFGVPLDGNGDGTAGDGLVRTFYALANNQVTFDAEIQANTTNYSTLIGNVGVGISDQGKVYAAWDSYITSGGDYTEILGRLFSPNGEALGAEAIVNNDYSLPQGVPDVAFAADGSFAVTWTRLTGSPNYYPNGAFARRFDSSALPLSGQFAVDGGLALSHDLAFLPDNSLALSYRTYIGGNNYYAPNVQRFNASNQSINSKSFPSTNTNVNPRIAANRSGACVMTWTPGVGEISAARLDSNLNVIGTVISIPTNSGEIYIGSDVAVGPNGDFVVVWSSTSSSNPNTEVFGQWFNSDGTPKTAATQINLQTAGGQYFVKVAFDSPNAVLVSWQSDTIDTDGTGISARVFSSSGTPVTSEFGVNSVAAGNQGQPAVAMSPDGTMVVAWATPNAANGIYYRTFQLSNSATTTITQLRAADGNILDAGEASLQTITGLVAGFNQAPTSSGSTSGPNSVINLANWKLTRDNADISNTISGITFAFNSKTALYEATINLSSPLVGGNYTLTAKATIQDTIGNALDGDGNGSPGGDFVRSFRVSIPVAVGGELRINDYTTGDQYSPDIASDAQGNAVIVWQSGAVGAIADEIWGQRIDANGKLVGADFAIATVTTGSQNSARVAMRPSGEFVVAWQSDYQEGNGTYGVYAQRFDAAGQKVGGEMHVNVATAQHQGDVDVGVNAAGEFTVVWKTSAAAYGFGGTVYSRRFAWDGTPETGDVLIWNASGAEWLRIAMNRTGTYVVTWDDDIAPSNIRRGYWQKFDAAGTALTSVNIINGSGEDTRVTCAIDGNGAFVLGYMRWGGDAQDWGCLSVKFDAQAKYEYSGLLNINQGGNQTGPAFAMDNDGDFVGAWVEGSGDDVHYSRFLPNGTRVNGTYYRANTYTSGYQGYEEINMLESGGFVIAWSSQFEDGNGYGVYMQWFAGNQAPVNPGFAPVNVNEDAAPSIVNLAAAFTDDVDLSSDLTYSVVSNSNPSLVSTSVNNTLDQLTLAFAANANGTATITVRALDTLGLYTDVPMIVNVAPINDPPSFVKGNNIIIPINYVQQTYAGWATNPVAGPSNESSQSVNFEIISNTRPDLFTNLQVLSNGSLVVDPQDELYGAAIIQVRAKDDGGTVNGGIDTSPTQLFTITIASDYLFGFAGAETRANTTKSGAQNQSAIAVDGSGNTVVVWAGNGTGDVDGIYGQRFNLQAKVQGTEFLINTTTTGVQSLPAVASTADGRFVVVWQGNGPGDADGIFAQQYNSDGTVMGGEFRVNTTTTGAQTNPSVSLDLGGNFAVAWDDLSSGNSDIRAQRFDASGSKLGSEFVINKTTAGAQTNSRISVASDGRFAVTWTDGNDVFYRRFDSTGTPSDVADVMANYYTTGTQTLPDISLDAEGDFVIVWQGQSATDSAGISARRFAANGTGKDATQLAVNVTTTNAQTNPRVSLDADGDFAVAWTGYGTTDGDGVFFRRFLADGTSPDAKGLRANSYTTLSQNSPAISIDHDGEFVVTWTSNGQDGGGDGVYLQRCGFPLPPVQTKTIDDIVVLEDSVDTIIPLFEYFSSSTGKTESMEYTIFRVYDPNFVLNGTPTINAQTGALTIRFATNRSGNGNITVRVRDTTEVPTLTTIIFTVISVNDSPQLASIPPQVVNEGSLLTFTAVGTDPFDIPANNLTYSLIGAPTGAAIDPTSGKFTWTPDDGPTSVTFTVRVTDDGTTNSVPDAKSADRSVTITVNNIAPSATGLTGPGTVEANKSASFILNSVNDAPGDIISLKYSFDWTADGIYDDVDLTTPTDAHAYSTPGTYTVRAKIADKDGGSAEYTTQIIVTSGANNPPKVQSVSVNDGLSNQRSRVDYLTIAFNSLVDFSGSVADAFEVLRTGPGSPMSAVQIAGVDTTASTVTQTIAKITFTGSVTEFGSLIDGNYSLRLLASKISTGGVALDGDGDGTPGDDYTGFTFHRLFGDADGNRTVTAADFNAFRLAYGTSGASPFDFDRNNQVSAADFNQFRTRYGVTLVP